MQKTIALGIMFMIGHIRIRLLPVLLLSILLLVAHWGQAQGKEEQFITLELRGETLATALSKIEKLTGLRMAYSSEAVAKHKNIHLAKDTRTLVKTLELILENTGLDFKQQEKSILIFQKQPKKIIGVTNDGIPADSTIQGKITNTAGKPLEGVSVVVMGSIYGTTTGLAGEFMLNRVAKNATLMISYVGFESRQVPLNGNVRVFIQLTALSRELDSVIIVSTGYQTIPRERATGSFITIDNKLLNRSPSPNILNRLDGVTNGLIFNKTRTGNDPEISIRGRSTIFSNTEPLIVVDNFPYSGNINNINPNDVESITILRDAAAASIWGAFSGNGVIVITTKKGRLNQPTKVSFNSNLTVGEKRDLFYEPQLSSAAFIELESFLFTKGFYNSRINARYIPISPVVEILNKRKLGIISAEEATRQIDQLKNEDVRNDYSKHFLRNSITQQYTLNISGGNNRQHYYVSAGYNKIRSDETAKSAEILSLNASNTYFFINNKLNITTGIMFTKNMEKSNTNSYSPALPYEKLRDENGDALPVARNFRQGYVDTAGGGRLLDWQYRPLDENQSNNDLDLTNYLFNAIIGYDVLKSVRLSANYQYTLASTAIVTHNPLSNYFTRDLINQYSQINSQTGEVIRQIPLGDIIRNGLVKTRNHYFRGQANFGKKFGSAHEVTAIAGFEIKDGSSFSSAYGLYGYNPSTATSVQVNYLTPFPIYPTGSSSTIPDLTSQSGTADRFRSYFINMAYTFHNRYILSASARKDESNLFGIKSNQRGVPLWSVGVSWILNKEPFYHINWLPSLKFRVTNGYNGNLNKSLSAYTTAKANPGLTTFGATSAQIVNPPNPSLRWEKVHTMNAGIDFSTSIRISGSVEAYIKNSKDLIGSSPIAAQTGITTFRGNTADLSTKGVDIVLNSVNIDRKFSWATTLLFSYVIEKVTTYKAKLPNVSAYLHSNALSPLEGKPYSSIFSYWSAGLDTLGNPVGFDANGKPSTNYSVLNNPANVNGLRYHGSGKPTIFGSLRNTLTWRGIECSFNIVYRAGYYFRRSSINYESLFSGSYRQPDYDKRWKQRGDELHTNVPGMIYPHSGPRQNFYTYSDVLVERGDHVRLQDIQLSYDLKYADKPGWPFTKLTFSVYAGNIGLLWKANDAGIDPDYIAGRKPTKTISLGINGTF